jgi:hypothetical protein
MEANMFIKSKESHKTVGYVLKMHNMDAKSCSVIIRASNGTGFYTAKEINNLYLVDAIDILEDEGVDPFEMQYAIEEMKKSDHDTAHFGMLGTFVFSAFEGVKQ